MTCASDMSGSDTTPLQTWMLDLSLLWPIIPLLLLTLLIDFPGVVAQPTAVPAVSMVILSKDGTPLGTVVAGTPMRLRVAFTSIQGSQVSGTAVFTTGDPTDRYVIPTAVPPCQLESPAQEVVYITCSAIAPISHSGSTVLYHLSDFTYKVDDGPVMRLTMPPPVVFNVLPSVKGQVDTAASPIVINVETEPDFPVDRSRFVRNLARLNNLPNEVNLDILDTRRLSSTIVQVVITVQAPKNSLEVSHGLLAALNLDPKVQTALAITPPVTFGTVCPRTSTGICDHHGDCDYTRGICLCTGVHRGEVCDQLVGPSRHTAVAATIIVACTLVAVWVLGWIINMVVWQQDHLRSKKELFTWLSPLHRTTPGTFIYRSIATMYLAACLTGCAFGRDTPWYDYAYQFGLPQIFRWIRLDFPDAPVLPMLVYGLVLLFVPYCIWINRRLLFLVQMDIRAWHSTLNLPATQVLAQNAMVWNKPRYRPPGYIPHYALLVVHFFYPTLSPMIFGILMSSFTCDEVNGILVARMDHTLSCFEGRHVVHAVISAVCLLLYYGCFLMSSYIFVAGTERLQNRTLELGQPSLIRDKRSAFMVKTQIVMVAIGCDVFFSQWRSTTGAIISLVLTGVAAMSLLVYQASVNPCNIPLCNWVAFASFFIPVWAYLLVAPSFAVGKFGQQVLVEVLVGALGSHIPAAALILYFLYRTSKGTKGQIPAWLAHHVQEATRREQTELARINSAAQLTKEELGLDVDRLPTPRSVAPSPSRVRRTTWLKQSISPLRKHLSPPLARENADSVKRALLSPQKVGEDDPAVQLYSPSQEQAESSAAIMEDADDKQISISGRLETCVRLLRRPNSNRGSREDESPHSLSPSVMRMAGMV